MPSHSVKQAKVMSAISHGWHPSHGSVAKIPVKVAKEFHAADAGHKYGKKHYTGGAIKAALNTVRKYHRKAEGGEVDDTPPDFNAQKRIYISPKIDRNEGLADDLSKKTPLEGREPFGPSLTATPQTPKDTIANALRGPDTKSYEPRAVLANKAMNVLEATPPMQALEAGQEAGKGNLQEAALGLMPAAKAAKPFGEALNYAANYAMQHDPQFGQFVFKKLKEQYPKDIATASVENGLTPEQIDNVKTYMSPGALKAFEKHYAKMAPKKEPSFAPSLWNTPDIQATKPNLTVVPKVEPLSPEFGVSIKQFAGDAELYPAHSKAWDDYDKLHQDFSQQPLNLTGSQKNAVDYWGQPHGYKDLNGQLRGTSNSVYASHYIPILDSAMQASPLAAPTSAWRGLHGPHAQAFEGLGVGDTIWNAGYTATTIDPRRATHYGGKGGPGVIVNYHLPAGQQSLYTSHPDAGGYSQQERELLLPHGQPFKITGIEHIKSPTWDYTGQVKNDKPQDFIVYHVAPAGHEGIGATAHQIDGPVGTEPKPFFGSPYNQQKFDDEFHQEPFQPHNEDEFHTEPLSGQKVFKPTGKDSDIEDYYAHQEKHEAGPAWEPDPDEEYHQSPHTKLTPEDVKAAPYKQLMHGKITQPEFLQKFREAFRPSDWSAFTPKDVEADKVKKLDFGANKPEDLEKLGFNTKTPIYKGGYEEYKTTYPAQLMNPQTNKNAEQAFFMATHPGIASAYGAVSAPYIARAPKFYEFDWDKFFGSNHYAAGDMHQVIERARELGADVIAIHNMHDSGSHTHGLHTQLAFLNTAVLRAPTAAFNPAKLHLAYPLAGVAGGGIFTYGALKGEGDQGHMKRGGKVKEKDPEEHEFIDFKRGGLIDSDIPGRTDKIPMKVSPGSYVLPADIPSALGQGNTKAGSDVLSKMFTSGPYGLKPMTQKPPLFRFNRFRKFAEGGEADHVPIVAAGGEFIIHPDVVKMLGEGNMAEGHKLLNKFVLHTRAQHIKTLRKLKPPKP